MLKEFYGHPSAKQDFVPDSREAGHLVLDARWGLRRVHPQSCRLHLLLALPVCAGSPRHWQEHEACIPGKAALRLSLHGELAPPPPFRNTAKRLCLDTPLSQPKACGSLSDFMHPVTVSKRGSQHQLLRKWNRCRVSEAGERDARTTLVQSEGGR